MKLSNISNWSVKWQMKECQDILSPNFTISTISIHMLTQKVSYLRKRTNNRNPKKVCMIFSLNQIEKGSLAGNWRCRSQILMMNKRGFTKWASKWVFWTRDYHREALSYNNTQAIKTSIWQAASIRTPIYNTVPKTWMTTASPTSKFVVPPKAP